MMHRSQKALPKGVRQRGEGQEAERKEPASCAFCGGQLERKNPYLYQCTSCKRNYYISASRIHRVGIQISAGRMIVLCAMVVMAVTAVAMMGYQYYTGRMVASASRFSVVFRDFLMEVYEKPAAEIRQEDLARIKYLKIEREKKYRFTYSYEDYYDYSGKEAYESTLHTLEVAGKREDFSPSNLQYFTGLTRLELYTEGWENYTLPEGNVLRGIVCVDGLSQYGNPRFFSAVNPDTLEEVALLKAEGRKDFSFLEHLRGVKRLVLSEGVLEDGRMLEGFDELEELYLSYVVMEEEDAEKIIQGFLSLPSLRHFSIEGKAAWYITKEQWENWEEIYRDRILLERK